MRVFYYTHPAFFEPALCLVRELSRRVELHLLLEISPGAWQSASFDVAPRALRPGLIPGDEVLRDAFPPGVRDYWQAAASFHIVSYPTVRSLHPESWRIGRQVLRLARSAKADVLHVDDVDVSPRLALALPGASADLPIVISVHDPEPHSGEEDWRKRLGRRLAYPRARRFMLYNSASRDRFAARYRLDRAAVGATRLGVYDVLRQWPATPEEERRPTVLFFGRISRYKGLDVFYEAARLVAARLGSVRFVVAGRAVEGYTLPAAPALTSGASLDVIERYLPSADAAALMRSATVVVCPYRDATQSGVVLSAFAFGVPVVATDVGGLPEYVVPGETGLLVPPGDASALAAAVCRIVEDGAFAEQLRRGIRRAADDHLNWKTTADALLAIYESAGAD